MGPLFSKNEDKKSNGSNINLSFGNIINEIKKDPEENYKKLKLIGRGSYGSVYKVQNKNTDTIRAMKTLQKYNSNEEEIINEISILKKLDHPNIIKIFEFYSNSDSYSLITEFCTEGDLSDMIKEQVPLSEKQCSFIMYQIFLAINYCHKSNILHSDLKPENILIKEYKNNNYPIIKICDFGTSQIFEKGKYERKLTGSSYYVSPEVINNNYNEKCDIWSSGVILYILLSGKMPFNGNSDLEIFEKIKSGKYDLESFPFDSISSEAKNLIKLCLNLDCKKRISAEEALKHSWFKNNESKSLYNDIIDKNTIHKLMNNLKNYHYNSIIQEISLIYLIHNFCDNPEVSEACKLFNLIDTDHDGKISEKELLKGLKHFSQNINLKEDVETIFRNIDANNNRVIEYEEFVKGAVDKKIFLSEEILRRAFNFFDKDCNGVISFDEIESILYNCIDCKSEIHYCLSTIFSEINLKIGDIISFNDFKKIMEKILQ